MIEPTLILRKVTSHPNATNAYRVVFDGVEVGSIGEQIGEGRRQFWSWGIDTVRPPDKEIITRGEAATSTTACCYSKKPGTNSVATRND